MAEKSTQSGPAPEGQPKQRLLVQVHEAVRRRYFSRRTEEAYVHWIKRFIFFTGKRHPDTVGEAEVTAFLNHLAADLNVAASTQNEALSALLFLYKDVLGRELAWLDGLQRAKRPPRLPAVLTRAEVQRLLAEMSGTSWLLASLLYGAGLRVMECLRLRVKDVDFAYRQILVRDGKGHRHADVSTMMIYTHVLNKGGRGVTSPLDKGSPRLSERHALGFDIVRETTCRARLQRPGCPSKCNARQSMRRDVTCAFVVPAPLAAADAQEIESDQ